MKKLLCLLTFLGCVPAFAQFSITIDTSANTLAQAIAGSGLVVFNAHLNCGDSASATFEYNGVDCPISKGVILCTGHAQSIANPGNFFCNTANGNNYSDASLMAIEPSAVNDVCILECDVIAMYANININFVFGSEEYPEFVNSGFNDAFGFFLTGPNPAGGHYNSTNIGALPNGVAVSINNVNANFNSLYFRDNYTSPNASFAYDGYTTLITSTAPIYADSVYHMKIAIADAADEIYDSGILLQDSLFISKPNTTGITKLTSGNIRISPNPARDFIHIEMPAGEAASIEIFNRAGQKVDARSNANERTVDISGLANGMYILQTKDKLGNLFTSKFVKE
jgi:hypothetical protein